MDSTAEAIVARIEAIIDARPELSQRALAEKAGLSVTQINRILNHGRKITATELTMIADALGITASELLGESGQQVSIAARVGRAERSPQLAGPFSRAQQLLEVRDLLGRFVSRPEVDPPPAVSIPPRGLEKDRGRLAAASLRAALGLDDCDKVEDLDDLAARFGLDVSTQPLPPNLHGLLVFGPAGVAESTGERTGQRDECAAVALLNGADSLGRRRFTLAHELGHLVFGDGKLAIADYARSGGGIQDQRWTADKLVEIRADNFAAHLLAPDAGVRALAEAAGPRPEGARAARWAARLMVAVASTYGTSFESAGYRARDAEVISEPDRARAHDFGATRAFKDVAQDGVFAELSATESGVVPPVLLLTQALTAYQADELGLKPLATLYDLSSVEEIEALRTQLHGAGWAPAGAPR